MSRIDEQLKNKITDNLCRDHRIDASKITIKVESGIAELTGIVSKKEEREAAEIDAKSILELAEVRNYIAVVEKPLDDPLSRVA